MIKKLSAYMIVILLVFSIMPVHAEGEDFTDTEYWTNLCTGSATLTTEQKSSCSAFNSYMASQSSSLKDRMEEIESQRSEIAANIQTYADQVKNYQSQADALNSDIATLNGEIAVKEQEIEDLQTKIDDSQTQIDAAESKIKTRMESAQSTMRLNEYLDILMGAKSFDDFIRIANGLSDITDYDEKVMTDLSDLIDEMNTDKDQLEQDKADLDSQKQEIVDKQDELLALKYQAQVVEEEYQKQSADLEAEGNKIAANLDAIQEQMKAISEKLNEVTASPGWTYPVPGAKISAGTWSYSSGGVHLGEDFAASQGTTVYAVGNGVIINRADGCPYGYLGSSCGYQYGGSTGGGNQVYLLTKINDSLYAVKYLHLQAGTPHALGTVMAGEAIGQVGSSGNSTGPHCHIEVFYLGSAGNFSSYAQSWNGDLAFGCGWGSAALSNTCESGAGAPCRIRPESVFGG
ncbi:MAG: peptidoglycan DD-metalloendopeptidase family protein [Solobacterium sp.]|nr:peptidoglycan DD-metalloendopeptidase family protein [Solobacterium sp.]MCH4222770.1 peptidoglycan DD-metalloendopeptidase family protein [Solobacterium sp.]MCH4265979.1 peptidoglycan DD-metalloendopeptidase family protein [Solobacterium sp.]